MHTILVVALKSELNISICLTFFQSTKHEEVMGQELQALKDQVNLKRSTMNDQVSHLESLREEVWKYCNFPNNKQYK